MACTNCGGKGFTRKLTAEIVVDCPVCSSLVKIAESGTSARKAKVSLASNPYRLNTEEYRAWNNGWWK